MKIELLLSSMLAFAVMAGCTKTTAIPPTTVPPVDKPELCVITGADNNTLPAETVILTAEAKGAASYLWYKGNAIIEGETTEMFVVTESGTYYAAGVNSAGTGEISDAKRVTIDTSGNSEFQPADLEGTYTCTGIPLGIVKNKPAGDATWTSEVIYDAGSPDRGVNPFFTVTNFGNTGIGIFLNIDADNKITIDQETMVCSNMDTAFIQGHFVAIYLDGSTLGGFVPVCEVTWDAQNQTLNFPVKHTNDKEMGYLIIATDAQTSQYVATFSDAYKNIKFTKN